MKRGRNQRRRQGVNPNRAYDSNGPEVRIRGTANQIFDKYQALARDAGSAGDRVKAENYLQHAEHYFRLIRAMQPNGSSMQSDSDFADGDQPSFSNNGGEDGRGRHQRNGGGSDQDDADEGGEDEGGAEPGVEAAREPEQAGAPRGDSVDRTGRKRRTRRTRPSKTDKPAQGEVAGTEEVPVN